MKRFCLLILCLFVYVAANAQLYQRVARNIMQQTSRTFRESLPKQLQNPTLAKSVFLLQEFQPVPGHSPVLIRATAFAIETEYNGKKQLWGITASHYRFDKPQITHMSSQSVLKTRIFAQGGGGINDIAIFPIPTALKNKIVPLHLAEQTPRLGEKLHSVGFFGDKIHHETNRTVKEIAPHRILTSLKLKPICDRIGACGGPVLNQNNEVVGVHVSSRIQYRTGGLVPADHIRDLLTAYHQKTSTEQPIKFNGVELEQLGINEFISEIRLYNKTHFLRKVSLLHHNKNVDYDHLEKLIDTTGGTEVVFIIQHQPLLPLTQGNTPHAVVISYNLLTGEVQAEQNDNLVPL